MAAESQQPQSQPANAINSRVPHTQSHTHTHTDVRGQMDSKKPNSVSNTNIWRSFTQAGNYSNSYTNKTIKLNPVNSTNHNKHKRISRLDRLIIYGRTGPKCCDNRRQTRWALKKRLLFSTTELKQSWLFHFITTVRGFHHCSTTCVQSCQTRMWTRKRNMPFLCFWSRHRSALPAPPHISDNLINDLRSRLIRDIYASWYLDRHVHIPV